MMLKSLLTIGLLQVLAMLIMLARTKGLALLLGPEMVGVMGVIDRLLAVIAQTASLSLPFAALRFLPAEWARGDGSYQRLLGRMTRVLLLMVGAATLLSLAVTWMRPVLWGAELIGYRGILLAGLLALPTLTLAPFLQNALAGRLQHNQAMLFSVGHTFVLMAASLLGIWWMGLTGFYLLYGSAGVLLAGPVLRFLNRPEAGAPALPAAAGLKLPWPVWRFSLFLIGPTFTAPFAALFVGYRVLDLYGAETTGWMQASLGLALAVRAVLGSAHPVFLTPNVNREGMPAERMHWANEYQKTLGFLIGVVVPPLLLFPDLAVRALYSSDFLPGAQFVFLFVLVEVVGLLAGTYQALIIAFDRMGFHVAQNVVAQLLVIGSAAVLIPWRGIAGAALAGLVAQVFLFICTTTFLRVRYDLRLPTRNLLLYALMVIAIVGAGFLGAAIPGLALASLALKAGAYLLLLILLALLLSRQDRANLRGHLGTLLVRLRPAGSS